MRKPAILVTVLVALLVAGLHSVTTAPSASAQSNTDMGAGATNPVDSGKKPPAGTPEDKSLQAAWNGSSDEQQNIAIGGILGVLLIAGLLFWLASTSDMLRDSSPQDFGGAAAPAGKPLRRPFSLAQSQMAWWFLLVLAAYLYLFVITGEFALSSQALTLMGIGTGTALGAAMVESNKTNPTLDAFKAVLLAIAAARAANPPLDTTALEQQRDSLAQRLASTNFLNDILTDVNGISLHRFQSVAWTVTLGAIFVIEVAVHRKMPEFDAYSLGVLGISGGVYLGFKIPEQPT